MSLQGRNGKHLQKPNARLEDLAILRNFFGKNQQDRQALFDRIADFFLHYFTTEHPISIDTRHLDFDVVLEL